MKNGSAEYSFDVKLLGALGFVWFIMYSVSTSELVKPLIIFLLFCTITLQIWCALRYDYLKKKEKRDKQ